MFAAGLLNGKVALVTGGGSGLGAAISGQLARLGATVVIAARKLDRLEAHAEQLRAEGATVLALQLDVRDSAAVNQVIATTVERFGRLDILVNNAAGNFFSPSVSMSDGAWNAVVDIDLTGTFYCSRAAGKVMLEQGSGRILNIVATLHRRGFPGMAHMTAAKAGIEALTRTLAAEWGPYGIRVNSIAPGPVLTEGVAKAFLLNPKINERIAAQLATRRMGLPEEIANVVTFLAGPGGEWVTGSTWTIDGGESLGPNMLEQLSDA